MDYSELKFVEVEVKDGVGVATLNSPGTLNAPPREQQGEFGRCLRLFANDHEVRVVVLQAMGKAFSVGGSWETEEYNISHPESQADVTREAAELVNAHLALDKPVITALQGFAFGSGAAFGLLADFIIVERHVKFGDGHIAAGLVAGDGGSIIWPMAVGMIRAKKYLLTGDIIDAEEAERIGLVTEVVETGEASDRAMALARRLADGPTLAIRYTKRSLNQAYRQAALTTFDLSLALEMESMYFGGEHAKGIANLKAKGSGLIDRTWRWRR